MSEAAEHPSKNPPREQLLKEFRQEAREYAKRMGLDPKKVSFWEREARDVLDTYGDNFDKFVEGHKDMVERGEEIIEEVEATGFNINYILDEDDFPFESDKLLIFYSNTIDLPEHFGLLLAEMKELPQEERPLISRKQVSFSKKANEFILGDWSDINIPEDTYILTREDGKRVEIARTIETVLIFSITDNEKADENALKIITFLRDKAKKEKGEECIPGSFEDPDIRISQGFLGRPLTKQVTESGAFIDIVSNVLPMDDGKLIVLRKSTRFEEDKEKWPGNWRSLDTPVNEELAKYVKRFGVGP